MGRVLLCTAVLATLTVALLIAQQAPSPTFEVASIRPSVNSVARRPVVDATGLTGSFDLNMKFTPDDAADPAGGASLFTAIQEQVGLRLESRRALVNVLVIESAERPTSD